MTAWLKGKHVRKQIWFHPTFMSDSDRNEYQEYVLGDKDGQWAGLTTFPQIWCDFYCASSLICWNKMPARFKRGFYCRSYCLLNMFRPPLCPSSGAQEYYTVVAACGIWCCGFQVVGLVRKWGLCIRFAGCCSIGHITLSSTPEQQLENHSTKYHRQQPPYNTLELLMMGIVVPETCWESSKICNKNLRCI